MYINSPASTGYLVYTLKSTVYGEVPEKVVCSIRQFVETKTSLDSQTLAKERVWLARLEETIACCLASNRVLGSASPTSSV